ncbi:MAG: GntR family transcriptional regulator, partial [Gammaproteobacteria bacterium]|nr:GntR family transcriptional regulator [Gammaproteobacteria bacterium]
HSNHNNNTSRVEEITAILRTEILLGQYRPGERMPSERDLAARFEVNRGAVREALKKLEQLGIADIKPGGVRVVPIQEATLEVLGHLMDLDEIPNPKLITQLFEVFSALMSISVRTATEKADDSQLNILQGHAARLIASRDCPLEHQENWKAFADCLSEINDNLVLRLIGNGLKTQFVGRLEKIGLLIDPQKRGMGDDLKTLDNAILNRDGDLAAQVIRNHFQTISAVITRELDAANKESERRAPHA